MNEERTVTNSLFCASEKKKNMIMWLCDKTDRSLNIYNCSELHSFMEKIIKNHNPRHIIFDLEGVVKIDSAVVGVLININRFMKARGLGNIVLTNITEVVGKILEMLEIRSYFMEFRSVDEALICATSE